MWCNDLIYLWTVLRRARNAVRSRAGRRKVRRLAQRASRVVRRTVSDHREFIRLDMRRHGMEVIADRNNPGCVRVLVTNGKPLS